MHPLITIYLKLKAIQRALDRQLRPEHVEALLELEEFRDELVASCFVPKILVGFYYESGIRTLLVLTWDNTSLEYSGCYAAHV